MTSTTAMHRNFIRTPRIISFLLFSELYINWLLMSWPTNPWVVTIISIGIGACAFYLVGKLSEYLTRKRVEKWAYQNYSIVPNELSSWLEAIDAVDLDSMVAMDLEGWDSEEPYSGCSFSEPEDEVQ